MGNQVTVKIDSRVFYVLLALVAVVGIFGIGWWLGTQLNGGGAQSSAAPPAAGPAVAGQPAAVDAGAAPTGMVVSQAQVDVATQQVPGTAGKPPVSADEVPVGQGESRIWLDDLADTNWTYDFGAIPSDKPSDHDFVVRNIGNAELVIQEASASCGCTAAIVKDSTVAAGEFTTVRVSYDPRVNREFGKYIKKTIRIKSNDPIVPLAEFNITADVAAQ